MHCVKNKLKISGECSPPEQRQKKKMQRKPNKMGEKNKAKMTVNSQSIDMCKKGSGNGMCVYNVTAFFYSDVLSEVFMSEA